VDLPACMDALQRGRESFSHRTATQLLRRQREKDSRPLCWTKPVAAIVSLPFHQKDSTVCSMKITHLETFLTNAGLRNYLFIRLRTDTGLSGVGEASLEWQEKTVQTIVHEWAEERILGRDPFDVEAAIG